MGDEQQPANIPYGQPVVLAKPPEQKKQNRSCCSGPMVVMTLLLGALFILVFTSGPSEPSEPSSAPAPAIGSGGGPTPTASLVPTYAPGLPTPTTPSIYGINTTSFDCQPGIGVGGSAVVVADSVRMRGSPGYLGKNDAIDTVFFLNTGNIVGVKGGPEHTDGLCWWHVAYSGREGWVADHSSGGALLLSPVQ